MKLDNLSPAISQTAPIKRQRKKSGSYQKVRGDAETVLDCIRGLHDRNISPVYKDIKAHTGLTQFRLRKALRKLIEAEDITQAGKTYLSRRINQEYWQQEISKLYCHKFRRRKIGILDLADDDVIYLRTIEVLGELFSRKRTLKDVIEYGTKAK
jgi:hypothetical protein